MMAVLGVAAASVIKQWKAELLPLLRVAVVTVVGIAAVSSLSPLTAYLMKLTENGGASEYVAVLWKAFAIAAVTHFSAEICRECGETGAAAGVELGGKAEILLLSLPLIHKLLTLAEELLSRGG